ncbi:MAG: hypothetical protein A3H98_09740 [Bacteroidetes bacterium RIFCSPLOWO2_02_FULL_36_8]|nr:MAG: hypothetical protein A3H98_09740 [Bacteroidetes bacterium RIFCSPLOWO2_02_FULL_36_8]OFY68769.1 MAG: hypothetical protein A3G23_02965 [Bacteroidetes bacterium RIFCSPLOWO2_12_FULL_37_12]
MQSVSTDTDELKNKVVENQQLIEKLNADLARKTQEVRIFQEISTEINATLNLDSILSKMLVSLDNTFGFKHSMVLLLSQSGDKLEVKASHGYAESGLGATITIGEGIIGVVAKRKKLMRVGNIGSQMAYFNSVKKEFAAAGRSMQENITIPGLPNVQSQVAIPLLSEGTLVGVLAVESETASIFDSRDEMIITILANQAASAIEKARTHEELKRINDHLEDLVALKTAEVTRQNNELEEKNKNITDSILYARRIQTAILPSSKYLDEHLRDYFIFHGPRDIVSGDFYWVNKKDNKLFFAAVDCTGHGVPGAIVSMVAHSNLQRALILFGLRKPSDILDKVNEGVMENFKPQDDMPEIQDGMDVALCALDREHKKIEFAGAYRPLILIRNNTLTEIKGNNQPIGHFIERINFTHHELDLQSGDVLYVFSDGYGDQFGYDSARTFKKPKKFAKKRFLELLLSIHKAPMKEQKEILKRTFDAWKGSEEQLDDVLVMGLRV